MITHAGFSDQDPQFTFADRILRAMWIPFQVPTFYIVSGFLYYQPTVTGWRTVTRHLRRLLLPYPIASLTAVALGLSAPGVSVVRALLTGSALHLYYFVFALACCILCLPVLSRMSRTGLAATMGVLLVYEVAVLGNPTLRIAGPLHLFWYSRDPLSSFALGLFLSGWLGAAMLPELRRWLRRWPWALGAFAGLAISVWIAHFWGIIAVGRHALLVRVLYTYGVVAAVVALTKGRGVPAAIQFLSQVTLGLYLYHRFVQIPLMRVVLDWQAPLLILTMTTAGLAVPCAVFVVARRLHPRFTRALLGA